MNCGKSMRYQTSSCADFTYCCAVERWLGRGNVADFLRLRVASTTGTRPAKSSPFASWPGVVPAIHVFRVSSVPPIPRIPATSAGTTVGTCDSGRRPKPDSSGRTPGDDAKDDGQGGPHPCRGARAERPPWYKPKLSPSARSSVG